MMKIIDPYAACTLMKECAGGQRRLATVQQQLMNWFSTLGQISQALIGAQQMKGFRALKDMKGHHLNTATGLKNRMNYL